MAFLHSCSSSLVYMEFIVYSALSLVESDLCGLASHFLNCHPISGKLASQLHFLKMTRKWVVRSIHKELSPKKRRSAAANQKPTKSRNIRNLTEGGSVSRSSTSWVMWVKSLQKLRSTALWVVSRLVVAHFKHKTLILRRFRVVFDQPSLSKNG